MKCDVSRDRLWAWVHGEEPDEASSRQLSEHVERCESCRRSAAAMRALVEDLRALSGQPETEGPTGLPEFVGNYRILRELGRGGMGVVYEAEQPTPRRRVALKVVRAGHLADEFQRRLFRREMQALARLSHPGIATIHDAGMTPDGLGYFAMEMVAGVTLSRYLQDTKPRPTLRQRLELFLRIGAAVTHAHQRGIIHRDLKPSNIMVTPTGEPVILDFGLARAIDGDMNQSTVLTESGRLLGTLNYMSPEQARGDSAAIDVRTDVYALGVILFELLTGSLPYELGGTSLLQSLQIICTTPPLNPRRLNRSVPADVVTITLKALEKDPRRRYQTVAELTDDVERFLTNHPIQARPAGRLYRLGKLVQRHALASTLLGTIILLSSGSAVVLAIQADRVSQQRDAARRAADKAAAINRFLREMLASGDPSEAPGRPITVREAVDRAARMVDGELAGQPEIEAAVRDTIGQVYDALGAYDEAERQLVQALAMRRQGHAGDDPDVADTLANLGQVAYAKAEYDRAESLLQEALQMRTRLFGPEHPSVAEALYQLGVVAWQRAALDEAERLIRRSLDIQRQALGPQAPEVAAGLSTLGLLMRNRSRFEEAESLLREALEIAESALPEYHPRTTSIINNLALVMLDQNHLDEAERLFRQALEANRHVYGQRHTNISTNLENLGQVCYARGDYAQAQSFFEQAVEMDRHLLGNDHPYVAMGLNHLAALAFKRGEHDEAEKLFLEALRIKRKIYGENHSEVAADLNNLGVVRRAAGDLDRAEQYFRQALAVNRAVFGDESQAVATNLNNIAELHYARGDYPAAETMHRDVLALRRRLFGPRHPETARSLEMLASTLLAAGRPREALETAQECLSIRCEALGRDDWRTAVAERIVGNALKHLERYPEAEPHLRHSYETLAAAFGPEDRRSQEVHHLLTELYTLWKRPAQAPEWQGLNSPSSRPEAAGNEPP